MSFGERIADILVEIIMDADDEQREDLAKVLRELQKKTLTYHGLRRQPFAAHIIDALLEGAGVIGPEAGDFS